MNYIFYQSLDDKCHRFEALVDNNNGNICVGICRFGPTQSRGQALDCIIICMRQWLISEIIW